jgi:hypothetical protein
MNQPMNDTLRGIVLCSDDPEHLAEFTIDDSWLRARPSRDRQVAISTSLAAQEEALIEDALRRPCVWIHGRFGVARHSTLDSRIDNSRTEN